MLRMHVYDVYEVRDVVVVVVCRPYVSHALHCFAKDLMLKLSWPGLENCLS